MSKESVGITVTLTGQVEVRQCDELQLTCAARQVHLSGCSDCTLFLCVMEGLSRGASGRWS